MKKNILTKGILVLVAVVLFVVVFTGCNGVTPPPPTTGTIVITIIGAWAFLDYSVWLDGWPIDTTYTNTYTMPNVTPGMHVIYIEDITTFAYWDYGTVNVVAGGTHTLTLEPHL